MARLAPGPANGEGRRQRPTLGSGEGFDSRQGLGAHAGRHPETGSKQLLERLTSLLSAQALHSRGPEHDAERAMNLESQTTGDQAGRGIIGQKPIRPQLSGEGDGLRFAGLENPGFTPGPPVVRRSRVDFP